MTFPLHNYYSHKWKLQVGSIMRPYSPLHKFTPLIKNWNLVSSTIAIHRDTYIFLPLIFEGICQSSTNRDLSTYYPIPTIIVIFFIVEMHGPSFAFRRASDFPELLSNDLMHGGPSSQGMTVISVSGDKCIIIVKNCFYSSQHGFLSLV